MQRHVAVITVIMIIQVQLLLPIGIVVGIVTIQDDDSRLPVIRLYKDVHKFLPNTTQILTVDGVLQAAHRGLGGKSLIRLRSTTGTYLKDCIISKIITVVAVFITRCYLSNTLGEHLRNRMINITLISVVCNTITYAIYQPHLIINLTKKQQATIAADIVSGEAEFNLFVIYWKKLVN
jgi:hypothetical protein